MSSCGEFETSKIDEGWNGKVNEGKEANEGTYFYIIIAKLNETSETYKGTLTLIK